MQDSAHESGFVLSKILASEMASSAAASSPSLIKLRPRYIHAVVSIRSLHTFKNTVLASFHERLKA